MGSAVSAVRQKIPPEIYITIAFFILTISVSFSFGLPIVLPMSGSAAFIGVHYIYPLLGIAALGLLTFVFGQRAIAIRFLVAMPCYAAVLFAHFNFKLWIPHINPLLFDEFYWFVDEQLRFFVDFSYWARTSVFGFIPYEANFYMLSFIALFYLSFCYFAIRVPESFGRLTVAVLLQQSLGALSYLVAPALGPFIYEPGLNPYINAAQAGMLDFHAASVAQGPAWLAEHGSEGFVAGLAAMPSLHIAGAVLFLLFAWRYARVLVPLFAFALAFITIASVASRWHYLIDLPVGAALAWLCYAVAMRTRGTPVRRSVAAPDMARPGLLGALGHD